MSNKSQLQTNNTKYASLIETLRGKAAGSSGEDVTEETSAYTTKLAQLETAITALETELEGKASGESGGSVEILTFTCDADKMPSSQLYENPFISGMTWTDFIDSPLNYRRSSSGGNVNYFINDYGVICILNDMGMPAAVSTDGTVNSSVLSTDTIESRAYLSYAISQD